MYKSIICLLLMLGLSSCSFIRKQTIEQGNIITPQMQSQLHTGMTEAQVRDVMGNPVLINIFTPNTIVYVYTYQKGHQAISEKRIICTFQRGRLKDIQQN